MNDSGEVSVWQAERWLAQAGWRLIRGPAGVRRWTKNYYIADMPTSGTTSMSKALLIIESVDANDLRKLEPVR